MLRKSICKRGHVRVGCGNHFVGFSDNGFIYVSEVIYEMTIVLTGEQVVFIACCQMVAVSADRQREMSLQTNHTDTQTDTQVNNSAAPLTGNT